jgi:hypothetical protein
MRPSQTATGLVLLALWVVASSAAPNTNYCAIRVSPGTPCAEQSQVYANANCAIQGITPFFPPEHPALYKAFIDARDAYDTCTARMRKGVIFSVPATFVRWLPLLLPLGIFLCVLCCQKRRRI